MDAKATFESVPSRTRPRQVWPSDFAFGSKYWVKVIESEEKYFSISGCRCITTELMPSQALGRLQSSVKVCSFTIYGADTRNIFRREQTIASKMLHEFQHESFIAVNTIPQNQNHQIMKAKFLNPQTPSALNLQRGVPSKSIRLLLFLTQICSSGKAT